MKKRNVFLMLVVFVLGMFAVCFSAKNVKAMEIAEDGEYTLVLSTTWDEDEYIDGKNAETCFRCRYCRRTCSYLLRRNGKRRAATVLQYLFFFYATGA